MQYVTAAFAFLAQRYSRSDERYGRAVDFVIGNEIDSQWVWQNMGQQTLASFAEYYTRALRLAYLAMRSVYAHPHVYISLDHFWTISDNASQPLEYYTGKATLDQIVSDTSQEGDFPWQVAYHPYPENLSDPYFWRDDTQATDDVDTKYITFKNIQVLSQYMALPRNRYHGHMRGISCSEEGVNLPQDPTLSAFQNQQVQAAAYAYAFYKLRFTPDITSFILYRQVQAANLPLRDALWGTDPDRSGPSPGTPRYIHKIYKYIDTPRSLELTKFALPIIGIEKWSDAIPNFDARKLATQPVPEQQVGAEKFVSSTPVRAISTFSHGTDGWEYADNADSVQASSTGGYGGGGELVVSFSTNYNNWAETKFWRGAELRLPRPLNASYAPYLTVDLNIPVPQPGQFKPGNVFYAKVKVYGPREHVAAGVVRIDPSQGWTPIAIDLSRWKYRNRISKIKVWVRGTTDDNWIGTFAISHVALARSIGSSPFPNLDVRLHGTLPGKIGSPVSVTVINDGTTPLDDPLLAQDCAKAGLNPSYFNLNGLSPDGGRAVFKASFSDYSSTTTPASICFSYDGETLSVPAILMPPPAQALNLLYGFQDGTTEGWTPGQNASSVAAVTSFANGPGTAFNGQYALQVVGLGVPADEPRSAVLNLSTPLDLSNASAFVAYVDSYGLFAGDKFSAFITLTSGTHTLTTSFPSFNPNTWNPLTVNISQWAYRNNITKIEIGFQCTTETLDWASDFQIGAVGTYQ